MPGAGFKAVFIIFGRTIFHFRGAPGKISALGPPAALRRWQGADLVLASRLRKRRIAAAGVEALMELPRRASKGPRRSAKPRTLTTIVACGSAGVGTAPTRMPCAGFSARAPPS